MLWTSCYIFFGANTYTNLVGWAKTTSKGSPNFVWHIRFHLFLLDTWRSFKDDACQGVNPVQIGHIWNLPGVQSHFVIDACIAGGTSSN